MPGGCFLDSRLPPAASSVDRVQPRFVPGSASPDIRVIPDRTALSRLRPRATAVNFLRPLLPAGALLEGVSERLQISRDDIDGTLYPTPGGHTSLVIFDTVPGGAGSAIRIARSFGEVLDAALARVAGCDCGEETSCYGCLRGYRNQPFHEELRRGAAVNFLRPLVPASEHLPGQPGPSGSCEPGIL
jgi:hypothetical protein